MYQHRFLDNSPCLLPIGKAVCVGRNYVAHIKELNNAMPTQPVIFSKPNTSFCDLTQALILRDDYACHYETELALLIGTRLSNATANDITSAIVGYTLALDLTLRDLQTELKSRQEPWELAKAFDGACPLGAFVKPIQMSALPHTTFTMSINNTVKQQGDTRHMLTDPIALIAFITRYITLMPGDIVLTGTPAGVGQLNAGDKLDFTLDERFEFQTSVSIF